MIRKTLNGQPAREVREITRDPFDWADRAVRDAVLGGHFPGMRWRRSIHTDNSLRARIVRALRRVLR